MNIGFDAKRLFNNFTGLGNYSRSLVSNLQKIAPENQYFLYSPKTPQKEETCSFLNAPYKIRSSKNLFWREKGILNDLKKDKIDIFHGLSHEIPLGIQHSSIKNVVTIHDLIFKIYPKTYNFFDTKIYDFKFNYSCQKADKIIAISESTKQDIIKFYGINESKIEVIYQACNPLFYTLQSPESVKNIINQYALPTDFLLYVGSIIERKNLLSIVKAYELLPKDLKIPLVIVGKGKEYKEKVKAYIHSNKLEKNFIWIDNLTDNSHLQALYQQAKIFIYPSVYEGFGIPVVEALLSKTPVITSNTSSLPEAAGPNSFCINPTHHEEMADKIEQILSNQLLAQEMIDKGYEYAITNFNGEKPAKELLKVYEQLLK